MKLLSVNLLTKLQIYSQANAGQTVGFTHCCQRTAERVCALTFQRDSRRMWPGAAKVGQGTGDKFSSSRMSYRDLQYQTKPTSVSFGLDLKTKSTLTFVLPASVVRCIYTYIYIYCIYIYTIYIRICILYVLFSDIYQRWVLALMFTPTNLSLGWMLSYECFHVDAAYCR